MSRLGGFGRAFGLVCLDAFADRAVDWGWLVGFLATNLFVDRVDKRVLTVLAGEEFVLHGYILQKIPSLVAGCLVKKI